MDRLAMTSRRYHQSLKYPGMLSKVSAAFFASLVDGQMKVLFDDSKNAWKFLERDGKARANFYPIFFFQKLRGRYVNLSLIIPSRAGARKVDGFTVSMDCVLAWPVSHPISAKSLARDLR